MIFYFMGMLSMARYVIFYKNTQWILINILIVSLPCLYFLQCEETSQAEGVKRTLSNYLRFIAFWFILISLPIILRHFPGNQLILISSIIILMRCMKIFSEDSFMIFFILFEVRVFPIIIIIMMGGKRKFRLEATLFLFIFTIFSSIIFLFFFMSVFNHGIYRSSRSVYENFWSEERNMGTTSIQLFQTIIFLSFYVKFPIFFFHVWLPKAHVEAPTYGSIILAGILLKLGGYGVILFQKFVIVSSPSNLSLILFVLWGRVWTGFTCYKQEDGKVLIAYSRVNHIGVVIFGLLQSSCFSLIGATILIVSHGFISSLIFFLNGRHYAKLATRSTSLIKQRSFPIKIIWLGISFINIGFPPFLRFWGEIMISINIIYLISFIPLIFLNFLVGCLYSITLMRYFLKKKSPIGNKFSREGEYFTLSITILHLLPLIYLTNPYIIF